MVNEARLAATVKGTCVICGEAFERAERTGAITRNFCLECVTTIESGGTPERQPPHPRADEILHALDALDAGPDEGRDP